MAGGGSQVTCGATFHGLFETIANFLLTFETSEGGRYDRDLLRKQLSLNSPFCAAVSTKDANTIVFGELSLEFSQSRCTLLKVDVYD